MKQKYHKNGKSRKKKRALKMKDLNSLSKSLDLISRTVSVGILAKLMLSKQIIIKSARFYTNYVYNFGEKGCGFRIKGDVQNFYLIRDKCLATHTLWEDPLFPADMSSLFSSDVRNIKFTWLRPKEIIPNPQLFVGNISRFDVKQGELGDCWMVAALSNLTLQEHLFYQVVPNDQDFNEKYCGAFHFRFWQYGRWIDVVVDDRLPTYKGKLVFLSSSIENEFWSALLEKAYAKLHNSYEALKGGSTCEAMVDFTGGICEVFFMRDINPETFYNVLRKAFDRNALIGCSMLKDTEAEHQMTEQGLVRGHSYSVTFITNVTLTMLGVEKTITLVRLRNPWGDTAKWNGAWSDKASEWKLISEDEKRYLGITFNSDGEFWMSYTDFVTNFDRIEMCNICPVDSSITTFSQGTRKSWFMSIFEGEWVAGVTAGGCRDFINTFASNPQYIIYVNEADDEDTDEGNDLKCTVLISLMQKNKRSLNGARTGYHCIGFIIYQLFDVSSIPQPLTTKYFKYHSSYACSHFMDLREINVRYRLCPGTYCIIPSSFRPNVESKFLIRVFSEKNCNMKEYDQSVALTEVDFRIKIKRGEQLPCPCGCAINKTFKDNRKVDAKDEKAYKVFKEYARKNVISWMELKQILTILLATELTGETISSELSRSLITLVDLDYSGKITLDDFKTLWVLLCDWTDAFRLYDSPRTNEISGFLLRDVLNSAGFQINNYILNILFRRYNSGQNQLSYEDFLMTACRLKKMIETYREKAPGAYDLATFPFEAWLKATIYG